MGNWMRLIAAAIATAAVVPAVAWSSKNLPLFDPVHQEAIDNVLKSLGVGDHERHVAEDQQAVVDNDQSTADSYVHAMTGAYPEAKPPADIAPWIAKAENAIHNELTEAIAAGRSDEGFRHLGRALHTLTDATSPAHIHFQCWASDEDLTDKLDHVMQERSYPDEKTSARTELEAAVRWAFAIFNRTEPALPVHFFKADGTLDLPAKYLN